MYVDCATLLASMIVPRHVGANTSNPWVTISSVGNEINALIEQNGKSYARLGAGAGNDNGAKAAVFQEQNKVAKESGTMEYSFIPETKDKILDSVSILIILTIIISFL